MPDISGMGYTANCLVETDGKITIIHRIFKLLLDRSGVADNHSDEGPVDAQIQQG